MKDHWQFATSLSHTVSPHSVPSWHVSVPHWLFPWVPSPPPPQWGTAEDAYQSTALCAETTQHHTWRERGRGRGTYSWEGGREEEEEEENLKSFSCAHEVLSLWDIVFLTEWQRWWIFRTVLLEQSSPHDEYSPAHNRRHNTCNKS